MFFGNEKQSSYLKDANEPYAETFLYRFFQNSQIHSVELLADSFIHSW